MAKKNINIEVKKSQSENNMTLIRRFSKRVMEAGIIQKVKGGRYAERPESKLSLKNRALKRIAKRKEVERLKKLGKMS